MTSLIAGAVLGGATNYLFDRKGDDMVEYIKSKTGNISYSSVNNSNNIISFSDYEVGIYIKDGKIYKADWQEKVEIPIIKKSEEIKEEPKEEQKEEIKEDPKKEIVANNNDIINLELMAKIATISFFGYTIYKILYAINIEDINIYE